MEMRQLGRSGLKVSAFTLGSMEFGGKVAEPEAADIFACALDHGVRVIDTANCYTNGCSEEIVGRLIAPHRERLLLATKFSVPLDPELPHSGGTSRKAVVESCEASLRRLGTDYVDIYYIHRPHPGTPIEETLRALDDLVRAGKVRAIGTSSFASWQLVEAQWCADLRNLARATVEQTPYHLLDRRVERELVPAARSHGVGLTIWSPLAGGLLTGKYLRDGAGEDRLKADDAAWGAKHFSDAATRAVGALDRIAREAGHSLTEMSLAWTLRQPGVSSIVLGARTVAQLEQQLAATSVELADEILEAIDEVVPFGGVKVPYYLDDAFADFTPNRFAW
ncbi:aldo/keto reductase [Pontivivens ytuae]|uniref:Aldo/keto reductase n=1 Tax=Pontivivens ytuae TaxID=2789856 RepID=A0A7S9QF16_9RHOB|nr:aldo/keto reductase [Pontivivens ytuae]QPH56047.1 aldo/keto reductase [Pontivivens ytuae]